MTNRPKILIIDNNPSTCLFIASTLQQAGYEVDIALTGQDGLAKVMNWSPQCLLLDIFLPDISGYAICRRVRQRFLQQIRILLMSIQDASFDHSYGLRQGADSYLQKPFTTETLLQEVGLIIPEAVPIPPVSLKSPPPLSTLLDLIPHRSLDQEAMRVSSPFATAPAIHDEQARRLYAAIDGKKTVTELAIIVALKAKEVLKLLALLLRENHIQIYDAAGQPVESAWLLSAL